MKDLMGRRIENPLIGQPLDNEEVVWLRPYNWDLKDVTELTPQDRKELFIRIWNKDETAVICKTCKAREGYCQEDTCMRLRVTHKLGLPWEWPTAA